MAHDTPANVIPDYSAGGHPVGAQGEAAVDAHGHPAHAPGDHGTHAPSVATYVTIFVALLALLGLTYVVARIPTNGSNTLRNLFTAVGYTIAFIKMALIIMFFMHVKGSSKLVWLFSTTAFFFMAIMVLMTMGDYSTRGNIKGAMRMEPGPPVAAGALEHGTADRPMP